MQQEKTDLNKVIEFLASRFPASFSVKGPAKPLKIGIFNEISERLGEEDDVSKTQVRHALRRYTNSWRYLEAVAKGGMRVDLDGQDAEALTEEHVQHAQAQLAESKQKFAEKKKAQAKKDGDGGEKRADKKSYKKPAKSVGNPPKRKPKSEQKAAPQQPAKPLVSEQNFEPGLKVLVKLGAEPMPASVVEVIKDEVAVQLNSGMVMKVKKESLYKA